MTLKTERYTLELSVNAGKSDNEILNEITDVIKRFDLLWKIRTETGISLQFTITTGRLMYDTRNPLPNRKNDRGSGCPPNGRTIVILTGTRESQELDHNKYLRAWQILGGVVRSRLMPHQEEVHVRLTREFVQFEEIDSLYGLS